MCAKSVYLALVTRQTNGAKMSKKVFLQPFMRKIYPRPVYIDLFGTKNVTLVSALKQLSQTEI